ncbi:MAG: 6-phosphofructokinase [Deltaproteobacteria bacterium]|nr:6-phosphofructokinase [Deltaproteobacteria bacterium]
MGETRRIGVLTSGGDSQGMNAAVRAVVRAAIHFGAEPYSITEGYEGMLRGASHIRRFEWGDVSGILHEGGTVIGSARCQEFRTREGRRQAAANLVAAGIDALVVIGGDGSLTGADAFQREWPSLLGELVELGAIDAATAARHPQLQVVGLVGSIDNDMIGTDMTIGADSALHRIIEAVDCIAATAASHQRSFVVEVMGRHAGYLALMAGVATGAQWILIPEQPPDDGWETAMCDAVLAGRREGRRHTVVIVAEGAIDRRGQEISSDYVRRALTHRLGEDARSTILGHVQRGGAPSAFDRNMSTLLGYAAVRELMTAPPGSEAKLVGFRDNVVCTTPLMENVRKNHHVSELIQAGHFDEAMALRGTGFVEAYSILRTLLRAHPHAQPEGQRALRIAIMHAGAPAPGMNTALRAAVRLGLDAGHTVVGIKNGLGGLLAGDFVELGWMSVHGLVSKGGAELGTGRRLPTGDELELIAERLAAQRTDALLIIGGYAGYQLASDLHRAKERLPALRFPIVCLPASINNDLPGTEVSIGADTALNTIVDSVDKLKESAIASQRTYVVEVMGYDCGYLALMGGLATGAERVYIPEEGITLDDLRADVTRLSEGFARSRRLGLIIRSERADPLYTTDFLTTLFEKEGGDLFDVRRSILGHIQQGGRPSPFDRIQATRFAAIALEHLVGAASAASSETVCIGRQGGKIVITDLSDLGAFMEPHARRPRHQAWLSVREVARVMAEHGEPLGSPDDD